MDEEFPQKPFLEVAKKLRHTKLRRVKKNDHWEHEESLRNVNNLFHVDGDLAKQQSQSGNIVHAESNNVKSNIEKFAYWSAGNKIVYGQIDEELRGGSEDVSNLMWKRLSNEK